VAGLLCDAECVIAYLVAAPAEADISLLFDLPTGRSLKYWVSV
jgi:hypothetical protein